MTRVPFRLLLLPVVLVSLVATAAAKDRRGPFVEPPRSVRSRDVDQQHVRLELAFDFAQRLTKSDATDATRGCSRASIRRSIPRMYASAAAR